MKAPKRSIEEATQLERENDENMVDNVGIASWLAPWYCEGYTSFLYVVYSRCLLIVGGRKGAGSSRRRDVLFRQRQGGWRVELSETSFCHRAVRLLGRPYLQREGLSRCMIGSDKRSTKSGAPTVTERSTQREASLLVALVDAGPDQREMRGQPQSQRSIRQTPQL